MFNLFNKLRCLLVGTMFAAISVSAYAGDMAPDVLVRTTTQDVTTILKRDKTVYANDTQKLYSLIDAKVLPHFDFNQMTMLAVGRYWRQATPAQQQALVKEFRTLLVRTYANALAAFNNQVIEFKPFSMPAGATDVTVQTQVKQPGAQPIPIDYSMEKTVAGWKVYDVTIDGVSLVLNYRGSFGAEIHDKGVDSLIKTLTAKNQQPNTKAVTSK